MIYYTVIDTNVLVSYFITKNTDSPIIRVVNAIRDNIIIPLFEESILEEYIEVLHRERFGFDGKQINELLSLIRERGINCERKTATDIFPDLDDAVFYEVAMSRENSYLVTGNIKHFPNNGRVVSPAEMMLIIDLGLIRPEFLSEPDSSYYMSIPLNEIDAIIAEIRQGIRPRPKEPEWPVLPPDFKVLEDIKMMQCIPADWETPSKEELDKDPRLAHILGEWNGDK